MGKSLRSPLYDTLSQLLPPIGLGSRFFSPCVVTWNAMHHSPPPPDVRLAEVVAALALATDLGAGQPIERSLRACLLAMQFGHALGMADADLQDVYYVALLRWVGCTANGSVVLLKTV